MAVHVQGAFVGYHPGRTQKYDALLRGGVTPQSLRKACQSYSEALLEAMFGMLASQAQQGYPQKISFYL